ncbi:MAG: VWA domain-containing protein, partial [Elusimicrobia bacterium]|nr:VWA domain-containing protein [Elusimicrobiota bacterium]
SQFIERLQGTDRVGLVVFAGQARTASPISIDYGNFEFKINRLEYEARGLKEGSDLGAAVKFAAESFDNAKKIGDRPRILIVVSDGESFDSEIETAIKAAKDHNVTIYTIGMGTAAGTKMKVPTEDGKGTEYIIDSQTGQPAVSHLVEAKLRRLAESTGGAYFHADKGATIDKVMNAVAAREKGRQGDTIKSPQPVGTYLLWPALALLLLDLLLPGRSLLRRDVPEAKSPKKKNGNGAAGMMGAALVPLAAWPQILPFALLAVAASALLAYDVWNDGALTRGAREAWQRRTGFVAKGVRSDLTQLYDLREADEPRLTDFLSRWQSADDKARPALIAEAAADDALWREKLTAAYLSGAAPATHEAVLTALRRTSRDRLEPLTPVVGRIAARRGALSWLDHSDAEARLKDLEEAASGQPFAVPAPAAPKPARRSLRSRLSRAAVLALLAVSALTSGLSVNGTVNFGRQQAAAEQAAFQIFYGDDMYIFTDRYVDDRIPQYVLPVMRAWHKSVRSEGPEFERAMQILRESPDPKADNILVVSFRRASLLPMDDAAQTTLLKALIERDSDALWASMDRTIAQSGDDPKQAELLVKLVALGAESGGDNAFMNLFRVLKSPNDQVRGQAFKLLYGAMASSDKTPFFTRLSAIDAKFAGDPALQMWSEIFAARRVSSPDAASLDAAQVKSFFDQLLKNAAAVDAGRPAGFAQALAQAQQSGQDPQTPPSLLALELGLMGQFEAQAQGEDSASPVPPALAAIARYAVNQSVTALIQEAEKDLPGLHERLIKDGVVLPDTQSTSYGGGEYDDYEGRGYYG